jgi:protein SCO1/2
MNNPARHLQWLIWTGVLLIILLATFVFNRPGPPLVALPVIGPVTDFQLTNQDGKAVSLEQLRGKVWVADIIFTRCPGPCRKMTGSFRELQSALPAGDRVRLVSLTSDPENDTAAVLKKYAAEFQADPGRWWFLTGDRKQLYDLALNGLRFVVKTNDTSNGVPPEGLITHSTWFALVDQQGRMRGWTDANGGLHATFEYDDLEQLARLRAAIRQLLREPKS